MLVRVLLLVCLLCSAQAFALDTPTLRAAILVRTFGYEKSLASGKTPVTVVVISSERASSEATAIAAAFSSAGTANAAGRPLVVTVLGVDAASPMELRRRAPSVVYVPGAHASVYAALSGLHGTLVLCGDPAEVGRGCMLSVETHGTGSRLVVDARRAAQAGLRFDARLLKLARLSP